ncbi:MAG: hypothetical protein HUU43_11610 [Ignavibacteriaceae bacterium]|nr:hypothetical protein [Ignavibacteriaceae bacterium]
MLRPLLSEYKNALINYIRLWPDYLSLKNGSSPGHKKMLIYMADGKTLHGGITDRLKGMLCAQRFAALSGIDFRINHRFPFRLTDYLVPGRIRWAVNDEELIYNLKISRPVYFIDASAKRLNSFNARSLSVSQIHLYCNTEPFLLNGMNDLLFADVFDDLFEFNPSFLQRTGMASLAGKSFKKGLQFRFRNALGDFTDINSAEHPLKDKLISESLGKVRMAHEETGEKIMVFSDSRTFIREALSRYDFVIAEDAEITHPDQDKNGTGNYDSYFSDLIKMALCDQVEQIVLPGMYDSYFPKFVKLVRPVIRQKLI